MTKLKTKTGYPVCPKGIYPAKIYKFNETLGHFRNKQAQAIFKVETEDFSYNVFHWFNLEISPESKLVKFLTKILNIKIPDYVKEIDLDCFKGRKCMVNVIHMKKKGRSFAYVNDFFPYR